MRLAPDEHDMEAFALLRDHLVEHTPVGREGRGDASTTAGSGFAADARAGLRPGPGGLPRRVGRRAGRHRGGGSIPFVAAFAEKFPDAAILVTGVEDPDARAHGANESLHLGEFEKVCLAEALLARPVALPR